MTVAPVCKAALAILSSFRLGAIRAVSVQSGLGFSDTEEDAVYPTKAVPFLLEDELRRLGGMYEKSADWHSHVVTDRQLVTGQNPASSQAAAQALLTLMA